MGFTSHTQKDYQTLVELAKVLDDFGVLDHHIHSRWRVYPQDVSDAAIVTVAAAAAVNTFGSWKLVIPVNIVPFPFEIIGLVVEQVSAATVYHIQLGYNPGAGEPGENMEMGERRLRVQTRPITRATEILTIHSQEMPANSSVWARMKTGSVNADTAEISVVLSRHVEITKEVPLWPAFPW